jgi:hypothetical protein
MPTGVVCPSFNNPGSCTIGSTYQDGAYFSVEIGQADCPGSSSAMTSNPQTTLIIYPDENFPVGGNYPNL